MTPRSDRLRAPLAVVCLLFALLLNNCSRAAQPPVLSQWPEQFGAMERELHKLGGDFVLFSGTLLPVRSKQGAPDEPIELRSTFLFVSPKSSGLDGNGRPQYPARAVHFDDYHLASTLRVDDEFQTIYPADPKSGEAARLIRLSPQDALRLTLAEGQAHLGEPVNSGNIAISLVRVSEIPPDVKALAVWKIDYYGKQILSFWIDAQTGAILKRSTTDK